MEFAYIYDANLGKIFIEKKAGYITGLSICGMAEEIKRKLNRRTIRAYRQAVK